MHCLAYLTYLEPIVHLGPIKLRVFTPERYGPADFKDSKLKVGENGYRKSMEGIMKQFMAETESTVTAGGFQVQSVSIDSVELGSYHLIYQRSYIRWLLCTRSQCAAALYRR
jgi:hypothetical protein